MQQGQADWQICEKAALLAAFGGRWPSERWAVSKLTGFRFPRPYRSTTLGGEAPKTATQCGKSLKNAQQQEIEQLCRGLAKVKTERLLCGCVKSSR